MFEIIFWFVSGAIILFLLAVIVYRIALEIFYEISDFKQSRARKKMDSRLGKK